MSNSKVKVLLVVSGSISAFKSASLVSAMQKSGRFEVRVVMTNSAKQLIGESTLEALSRNPVASDLWQNGEVMEHIELGKWADLLLVYPATANLINSWAHGLASDLAGTLYLAFPADKDVWIAPAMNQRMLAHPATEESISLLRKRGAKFLDPKSGRLACGEVGDGRLIEPEEVFEELSLAYNQSWDGFGEKGAMNDRKRVLVVYGGTRVPIDAVRSITNTSTGKTGAALAGQFFSEGYCVDVLRAKTAIVAPKKSTINSHEFDTFSEFRETLERLVESTRYDLIVQLAAVSDYVPQESADNKISTEEPLSLKLVPTEKIVNQLKSWSLGEAKVVAFKLTVKSSQEEVVQRVAKVFERGGVDLVVQNDLTDIKGQRHPFLAFNSQLEIMASGDSISEMGSAISEIGLAESGPRNQFEENQI